MAKEKSSISTAGKQTTDPALCHREPFKHAPLDKESRQIRVLDILPKLTPDGLVQCRQRTITLNDSNDKAGEFRALSYEWRSPESSLHPIVINDGTLLVRSNLHDFLCAFRKKHSIRKSRLPLWIDAVCIDQENTSERNHQVRMMRDIYSQANEVIVWLGTENCRVHYRTLVAAGVAAQLSKVGGADLEILDTASPHNTRSSPLRTAGTRAQALWSNAAIRLIKMMPWIVPQKPRSFRSIELTYLSRAWIWQEILLARKVQVFFGPVWLNWETVLILLDFSRYYYRTRPKYDMYTLKAPIPLDLALEHFAGKSCKLEHDKVYSVLGIVDGGETFPVRYDSTLLDLMVETSSFCLKQQFRTGFSPQTRGPLESVISYLANFWWLYTRLTRDKVTQITESRREQFRSHYSDECYAKEVPRIRDFRTGTLTAIEEAVPHDPQLQLWLQNSIEQMSCTHCIVDQWSPFPAAHPWTASIFLLRKDIATLEESAYNIVGQLRVLNNERGQLLVRVYAESYGNPGLPRATVIEKIDISNWQISTVLECSDIRSAITLMGLPYDQWLRRAAMDLLYDVRSFSLPRVTYFSAHEIEVLSKSGEPNSFDREFHFFGSFIWEPPRREPEIA